MSIDDIDLRKTEVLMGNVFPLRGKVAAAPTRTRTAAVRAKAARSSAAGTVKAT